MTASDDDDGVPARYTMLHFTQNNRPGTGFWHVPSLLRSVADTIERIPDVRVHDITFHKDYVDDNREMYMTVYYSIADAEERARDADLGIDPTVPPPEAGQA
jgi:hypothetical protein